MSGSLDDARRALEDGADYVGVGAMFSSSTKPDKRAVGPAMIAQMRAVVGDMPIVAIGGIDADTAGACIEAGADGVALVSSIFKSDRVCETSEALRSSVDAALKRRSAGV